DKMRMFYIILFIWASTDGVFGQDRWVWGTGSIDKGRNLDVQTQPHTTLAPPITTFRPRARSLRRGSFTPSIYHNGLPHHPFFPRGFFPFEFLSPDIPKVNEDGTTKSRVTVDTATLNHNGGASLAPKDKYTTLDRLQRERGPPPKFPPPEQHQLGGLHPDEVFYADDNLLIIRGGGFNSDAFQEPKQPLDDSVYDGDEDYHESTRVVSSGSSPSLDQEYNGNIPFILTPPPAEPKDNIPVVLPHQFKPSPLSIFVGGSSNNHHVYEPFFNMQSTDIRKSNFPLIPLSLNDINMNSSEITSKLRRSASAVIPYVYPAPSINTFALTQPTYQHQRTLQAHSTQQQTLSYHSQAQPFHHIIHNHPSTQRGPLQEYQPAVLQHVALQPQSHYVIQSFPAVQNNPAVHVTNNQDYSQLELQPQTSPVYHSLEGDTRVNFLHPLPTRTPEAEIYTPHFQRYVLPTQFISHGISSVPKTPTVQPVSEIEIKPENPPVFRVLKGDINVNYLPPRPRQNPDAEAIQPQYHHMSYVNTRPQSLKPRI
ncbi:hypothetical protein SK128_006230, partial [Halocaridina rubra]